MDILGIGMPELIFIVLIALIILGPKDMEKTGRTIGRWLNSLVKSEGWQVFRQTSKEVRDLPNRLMREANIEELEKMSKEIKEQADVKVDGFGTWGNPAAKPMQPRPKPAETEENRIAPPQEIIPQPSEEKNE